MYIFVLVVSFTLGGTRFFCEVTLLLVTIMEQRKKGTDQNELYEFE